MKKEMSITFGVTHTRYYNSYREAAEDLGIKNASRKGIESHCKGRNMTPDFD